MEQTRINVKLAWESIRANKLRAVLTLSIIAFGIMALVGILTAIAGLKSSISSSFSSLGANTFNIRQDAGGPRRRGQRVDQENPPIRYDQALAFKEHFRMPAIVSLSVRAAGNATLQNGSNKTNPNVRILGVDENYVSVGSTPVKEGRAFSQQEAQNGSNVIVLGYDVVKKIFPTGSALGHYVLLGDNRYLVIGTFQSKGSGLNNNADNAAVIPLVNALRRFTGNEQSVSIAVAVSNLRMLNEAVDEATSQMRNIRRLPLGREDNFDIRMSDSAAKSAIDQLSFVTLAATFIGLITLFGAGIGLMNIMLVLVTERTREIGVSKALGATKSNIRMQFLTEAVLICQMGGALGIVLGILVGNLVSVFFSTGFIVPWGWVIGGFTFCFIVGILAGIYPAIKASNLDPIDALRYE